MSNIEEYELRKNRMESFLKNNNEIKIDVTPEMQYVADGTWLLGFEAGKEYMADKVNGLLTNMNNKMED